MFFCHVGHEINGITPALRKRRERDARNKSLIKEQEENGRGAVYHRSDSLSSSSSVLSDTCENSSLVQEEKTCKFEKFIYDYIFVFILS